jgi:chromosome partitioning protein
VGEIIACANQKGGVGKTTTIVSFGAYLALDDRRVLLLDLDPQGNATSGLGIDRDTESPSIYDVLLADVALAQAMVPTAMPASRWCRRTEPRWRGGRARFHPRARTTSQACHREDRGGLRFILLDCPPSWPRHGQRSDRGAQRRHPHPCSTTLSKGSASCSHDQARPRAPQSGACAERSS